MRSRVVGGLRRVETKDSGVGVSKHDLGVDAARGKVALLNDGDGTLKARGSDELAGPSDRGGFRCGVCGKKPLECAVNCCVIAKPDGDLRARRKQAEHHLARGGWCVEVVVDGACEADNVGSRCVIDGATRLDVCREVAKSLLADREWRW